MKAVAVKELKNRLSAYLREVKAGEVVLVTDRGMVVAELRQPGTGATIPGADAALARLAVDGALVPGLPQRSTAYRPSPLRTARASADLLDAERGDR